MNQRIKEVRKKAGLTQQEFAERIGSARNTIANYEIGNRTPSDAVIHSICREFCLNEEWLRSGTGPMEAPEEIDAITEVCRQYGAGDAVGRIFKAVMDMPGNVRNEFAELLLERLQQPSYHFRTIAFFGKQASAGSGQIGFDDFQDTLEIENNEKNARVVYAVAVNGDSMEPLYVDGDILLVAKDECNIGDVGIFLHDGKYYVKERGETELLSLNQEYAPLKMNEETRCLGKVLGKA